MPSCRPGFRLRLLVMPKTRFDHDLGVIDEPSGARLARGEFDRPSSDGAGDAQFVVAKLQGWFAERGCDVDSRIHSNVDRDRKALASREMDVNQALEVAARIDSDSRRGTLEGDAVH